MTPSQVDGGRRPPLTATAIVAAATLASLVAGVVANKAYAVVLGPSGVGIIAIVLSVLTSGAVVANLGIGTSVGQAVGAAAGNATSRLAPTIETTARRLALALVAGVAIIMALLREPIADVIFGARSASPFVLILAAAVAFTALTYVESGILTGRRQVTDLAQANAIAAIAAVVIGIPAVVLAGVPGFIVGVLAVAVVHFWLVRSRTATSACGRDTLSWDRAVAGRLLRLGFPAGISQLSSVGAQLLIPILILQTSGSHHVGLYRAASVISTAYLALFLSTLSYEYLPRLAGVARDRVGIAVDDHMRLLLGLAVPLILALFALGPMVLTLLFTEAFADAIVVLQWQLVGDLLRLPAWALAYALIARSLGGPFLLLELTVGVALVVALPIGLSFLGLEGVGIGYAIAQALYLGIAWWITVRNGITAPGRLQATVLVLAASAALSIIIDVPLTVRGLIFGACAVAAAVVAAPRIYRMHQAGIVE